MRRIVFVSDLAVHDTREKYRAALRAMYEPVAKHLPEAEWSEKPVEDALNVRFFTITLDGRHDVFVGHGLADKLYSPWHIVRDFPWTFCSGTTWYAKYIEQGATPDRLRVTGFPKLDPLFDGTIKRRNGARILWAPTHPTAWPAHYGRVRLAVESLPFDIDLREHPQLSASSTLQPFADADVVIADGGSSVYEAWALGKPVVFPTWLVHNSRGLLRPGSLERYIYVKRIGYHSDSPEHFESQIRNARRNGITKAEAEFAEGILPTHLRGTSGRAYAEALRELAEA